LVDTNDTCALLAAPVSLTLAEDETAQTLTAMKRPRMESSVLATASHRLLHGTADEQGGQYLVPGADAYITKASVEKAMLEVLEHSGTPSRFTEMSWIDLLHRVLGYDPGADVRRVACPFLARIARTLFGDDARFAHLINKPKNIPRRMGVGLRVLPVGGALPECARDASPAV